MQWQCFRKTQKLTLSQVSLSHIKCNDLPKMKCLITNSQFQLLRLYLQCVYCTYCFFKRTGQTASAISLWKKYLADWWLKVLLTSSRILTSRPYLYRFRRWWSGLFRSLQSWHTDSALVISSSGTKSYFVKKYFC